jgi:uroporphyrinogen-III synthase
MRALFTRDLHRAKRYVEALQDCGWRADAVAVTSTVATMQHRELAKARQDAAKSDALAFASVNAVQQFFAGTKDSCKLPRCYAVGDATARALRECGQSDLIVADEQHAQGLAAAISQHGVKKIYLPRADIGRPELSVALAALGIDVTELVVYRTALRETSSLADEERMCLQAWLQGDTEVACVFAPSQVDALMGLGALIPNRHFVAIGETTAAALRVAGVQRLVVANEPNVPAVTAAVLSLALS